jgi:hypothetical protein
MDSPQHGGDSEFVGPLAHPLGQPGLSDSGLPSNDHKLSRSLGLPNLTQLLPELLSLALPANERNRPEAEKPQAEALNPAWFLPFIRPSPVNRHCDLGRPDTAPSTHELPGSASLRRRFAVKSDDGRQLQGFESGRMVGLGGEDRVLGILRTRFSQAEQGASCVSRADVAICRALLQQPTNPSFKT